MDAATAFAVAAATHAGFQLTVTVLVYPALAAVGPEGWTVAHAAHSRRIAPLVGLVYGALLLTGGRYVATGPDPLGWAALASTAGALAVTATAAAPLHGRLTPGDPRVRTLLRVDRVRCAFAVTAAVVALVALRSG